MVRSAKLGALTPLPPCSSGMNFFARILRLIFGRRNGPPSLDSTERQGPNAAGKSKRLTGLDVAQYAPLDDQQALSEAQGLGDRGTNPWFGRRDLIPPASDPRTALIDRLMVAEGLTTSEELNEIRHIGQEMDRLRPLLAHAAEQAEQAVELSEQERQRLKAEKRQAAARRRAERADAIRHRHATDIIYLGRGVSRGLADRQADEPRLESFGLPLLATPADVAAALGLDIPRLRWLAFHAQVTTRPHYVQFVVTKKSGGERILAAPHRDLRGCQVWIDQNILRKIPLHEAAQGFVTGRSTITNAAPHVGQKLVVNTDLADIFPSITFPRVMGLFTRYGYSPAVATILALLTTEAPRQAVRFRNETQWVAIGPRALPQGAPTSPGLSNLIAWRLDHRLDGLARKLGWQYTRYADDLTFSTSEEKDSQVGYLLARVRHIVVDEGFALQPKKTRVQRPSAQQSVTGIVVNQRPGISRKTVRRLRAILHNAQQTGLAAQNRENHPHFESYLAGMIAYVRMVNPQQAAPLEDAWERLRV